jgi:beta-phosphoglucomutase family hydrolase
LTRAIIWDMDGVIADSGDAHFQAWQALFAERGSVVTREQFEATFGMANPAILRQWVGEDTSKDVLQRLGARKEQLFRQMVEKHVHILPGVEKWLARACAQDFRQACASSGEMANIVAVLAALNVVQYFDALLSGAFLPKSKPDPAIFLQAAAAVGAEPAQCVVIEDGTVGVEAAKRAGMRCIAVTTTHPADKLSDADLVVDSLEELAPDTFERLLGQG